MNDWLALRLEGNWTRAPLRIKSANGDQGVTLDAGNANVSTFVIPLVVRLNRRGALRFHLMGGPAYALYNVRRRTGGGSTAPLFEGTRGRWGGAGGRWGGGGVGGGMVVDRALRGGVAGAGHRYRLALPRRGHWTLGERSAPPEAAERTHDHRNPISFLM